MDNFCPPPVSIDEAATSDATWERICLAKLDDIFADEVVFFSVPSITVNETFGRVFRIHFSEFESDLEGIKFQNILVLWNDSEGHIAEAVFYGIEMD